jgi:hypothetical protein
LWWKDEVEVERRSLERCGVEDESFRGYKNQQIPRGNDKCDGNGNTWRNAKERGKMN